MNTASWLITVLPKSTNNFLLYTKNNSWLKSSPATGRCLVTSLTMIRENTHSMHMTTSGISNTVLTRGHSSITHWNTYMTSLSPLRLRVSVRLLTSSSCISIKKKCARLKNACGKPVNSKMPVHIGWRDLMH